MGVLFGLILGGLADTMLVLEGFSLLGLTLKVSSMAVFVGLLVFFPVRGRGDVARVRQGGTYPE